MTQLPRLAVVAVVGAVTLAVAALAAPVDSRAASGASSASPALYSASQAKTGMGVYNANCAQCHGAKLEGGAGPPLSGPNMVTLGKKTNLHVGEMFQYITTNMPMSAPASLSHDQYVAVLAYILSRNGYPVGAKALSYTAASSSKVLITSYKH